MKAKEVASRLLLPNLLLAAAATVAGVAVLVVVELLSRRLDPRYLDRVRGAEVYSERYGWALRPGFSGPLHDVPTTVNARGYRGELHAYEKTPGKTRVVMLGDSITFGFQVRDFETFSSLLEHRGDRYEVVNLGVEGYGTDQELLVLEEEGLRYHPDVVILNVCVGNDPLDNLLAWSGRPKPHFTWDGRRLVAHDEGVRLPPSRRAIQWLADESHVINRLRQLFYASNPPPPRAPRGRRPFDANAADELTVRIVCEVGDVARRAGAALLVLVHPDRATFERRSAEAALLVSALRDHGIRVHDLAETYRAARLGYEQVALDGKGHLTPLAHHVVAEEIERLLEPPTAALPPGARLESGGRRSARRPGASPHSARKATAASTRAARRAGPSEAAAATSAISATAPT